MTTPQHPESDVLENDRPSDASTTALTVWHYGSAMGASAGELRLRDLEKRGALTVLDAVTLLWLPATPRPRVGRFRPRVGTGGGPGAVLGALASRLRRTGIDEAFLEEIEKRLVPGTSALLVLSANVDLDAIRPVLERGRGRGDVTLMHVMVRDDAPQSLRDALENVPPFAWDSPVSGDPPPAASPLPSPVAVTP